jgi:Arc/MetJ-type ribon-helix-helix transcriptional regulator
MLISHDYNVISMANEMFQARLPDGLAEEVHQYKEDRHMSKSEAVRALLRAGLEAETEEPEPPEQTPANGLPENIRRAYNLSGYLADGGMALLAATFLLWLVAFPLSLIPTTVGVALGLAVGAIGGFMLILAGLVLVVLLAAYEKAVEHELAEQARRFDLRRWVAT